MKLITDREIIIEDPFVIRPGTTVTVTALVDENNEFTWDSSADFDETIDGFAIITSLKSDKNITPLDVTFEYTTTTTRVVIEAQNNGTHDLDIYARVEYEEDIISKSALSSDELDAYNLDNYEYIVEIDDKIIPMTLIDITGLFTLDDLVSISLTSSTEDRGFCEIGNGIFSINSKGMLSNLVNVLRKGTQNVLVSGLYTGDYIRLDGTSKFIEIDNQELSVPGIEFFGMENVGDVVFIMTSNGLYGFNKWDDYIDPVDENNEIFYWNWINGTDITYCPDDSLAIPSGTVINKYYLRHDFVLLDRDDNKIYFREPYPNFEVT